MCQEKLGDFTSELILSIEIFLDRMRKKRKLPKGNVDPSLRSFAPGRSMISQSTRRSVSHQGNSTKNSSEARKLHETAQIDSITDLKENKKIGRKICAAITVIIIIVAVLFATVPPMTEWFVKTIACRWFDKWWPDCPDGTTVVDHTTTAAATTVAETITEAVTEAATTAESSTTNKYLPTIPPDYAHDDKQFWDDYWWAEFTDEDWDEWEWDGLLDGDLSSIFFPNE